MIHSNKQNLYLIGKTFSKYGKVIGTSRSDYTDIAKEMGATYIPLSDPEAFLAQNVDVIVFAVSIMSLNRPFVTLSRTWKRTWNDDVAWRVVVVVAMDNKSCTGH
jgi:hypothetical protein